jgi:hypothetical protein
MSKDASDIFPPPQQWPGILDPRAKDVFQNTYSRPTGYHLTTIQRAKYGTREKILEEMEEVKDSIRQANPIMTLLELSDVVGACVGYLERHKLRLSDLTEYHRVEKRPIQYGTLLHHFDEFREFVNPLQDFRLIDQLIWNIGCYVMNWNLHLNDVICMQEATHRAFETGARKPKLD